MSKPKARPSRPRVNHVFSRTAGPKTVSITVSGDPIGDVLRSLQRGDRLEIFDGHGERFLFHRADGAEKLSPKKRNASNDAGA